MDDHSGRDDAYQEPLWYGDGFTEDDWVAAWRQLAARYGRRPNVIGADLKNEPHGPATWGAGGPTDWRRAAERAGDAVTAIAPHWLVVVEGIEGSVPGEQLDRHWWGGNLEGVRRARQLSAKPLVAIGGITRVNCRSVIEQGADSVAVISDLLDDPEKSAEEFLRLLG